MDTSSFDRLTRTLASTGTRRSLLGLLVATLGVLGEDDAGAIHFGCKHVGERCRRGRRGARSCCSGVCQPPPGGGRRVCTKTTSPDPACAGANSCGPGTTDCSRRGDPPMTCYCGTTAEEGGICIWQHSDECGAECTTSDDCGPDAVCVESTTCCGPPSTGKVCYAFVQRCKVRT